ncbi:MAG: DMT family transporter, partial [Pseudomonadota bacterium]
VVMIGVGIMSLAFTRGAQNLRNPVVVIFALTTGLFIAGYTITDGLGARLAGSAHAYAAWMMGLEWIPLAVFALWVKKDRFPPQAAKIWRPAALMGVFSLAAYWAVIWAMTVAPIALVAGLRETSIIFAVLIGVLVLNERLSLTRLAGVFTTLVGAVLLRVSRP